MTANALPDFNSRQLRAVLAVAEYRSFIAAAAFLKISQPALTRTIKQVETALGVSLFSRTTRQVATTPAGKEFAALAERLLNDLKIGVGSIRKHHDHQRGQIIVSSVLALTGATLPALIVAYSRQFPGIDIHLREGIQSNVLDDVRSGVADFGIGYVDGLPKSFVGQTFGAETYHVVIPSKSSWTRIAKIDMRTLKEAIFVSYPVDSRTRYIVDSAAAAAGFAPRYAVTVNRHATLMSLVRHGIGVAIVPASECPQSNERDLTSRPLAGAKFSRLGVLRLRERELSPTAESFLAIVKEWIRDIAPRPSRRRAAVR